MPPLSLSVCIFWGEKWRWDSFTPPAPVIGCSYLFLVTLPLLKIYRLKPASVRAKLFISLSAYSSWVLFISARRPSLSSEKPKVLDLSKNVTLWYSFCGAWATSASKNLSPIVWFAVNAILLADGLLFRAWAKLLRTFLSWLFEIFVPLLLKVPLSSFAVLLSTLLGLE